MLNSSSKILNGKLIVHIEGTAAIDTISQLHQIISEALESQLSVLLDIDKDTECDASFIQLIGSLCYTLNRGGRILEISQNPLPDSILDIVKTLGFHSRCKCIRMENVMCPLTNILNQSEQKQESLL
jgi:hypothetical protein